MGTSRAQKRPLGSKDEDRQTWHGRVGQSSAVCMGEAAVGGCRGMAQPHGCGHSCMGSSEGHFVFTWKRLCRNINSSPLLSFVVFPEELCQHQRNLCCF